MKSVLIGLMLVMGQLAFAGYDTDLATQPPAHSHFLKSIAERPQEFSSVEAALGWLGRSEPFLFDYFTLMHTSQSLQGASFLNPRAIAYGPSANFIVTFNGDPTQLRYDALETFEYLPPDSRGETRYRASEVHFGNSPPTIKVNSAVCRRCHEAELRPIWAPYEIWEGAYGKRDDALIDYEKDKYAPPHESAIVAEGIRDLRNFKAFKELAPFHERYRYLRFPGIPPFWLKQNPNVPYEVSPYGASMRFGDYRYRPNLKLTGLLAEQNADRIARRLQRNDACYQRYGKILLANLLECADVPAHKAKMTKLLGEARGEVERLYESYDEKSWSRFGPYASQIKQSPLLLQLLGVDRNDFNLSFNPDVWNYFEGSDYMSDLVLRKLYSQLGAVLRLRPYETYSSYGKRVMLGKELENPGEEPYRERAEVCQAVLNAVPEEPSEKLCDAMDPTLTVKVKGMCLSCHNGSEPNVPVIPLENKAELLAQGWGPKILRRIASEDEKVRMPPTRRLSVHEKRALRQYLH